jgi:hypothetical protein
MRLIAGVLFIATCSAVPAQAQISGPIEPFVADVRGVWARFKEDPGIAAAVGVTPVNLPTRGLGIVAGAHWYPFRLGGMTLGVGGEFLTARDSRTLDAAAEGEPEGPTVDTRMTAVAPQVSVNFGKRDGWSYISGGIGWGAFTSERADQPVGDADGLVRSTNYGGGARWFIREHLALSVDLRFYAIAEQPAAPSRPAYPSTRLMVISVGASFR